MSFVLDFESQVLEIEKKIKDLREASNIGDINVASEISKMQGKVDKLLAQVYKKLTPWQKVQVARHPDRPKFLDYLAGIFSDFVELSGDRAFADDCAIIGGLAKLGDIKCVVIGQEKGSDTESRIKHNFGMARPEGYRKIIRLLDLADRFSLPVFSFIDTAGAFPGTESEERGIAEAIARCMEKSLKISVPFVSAIIGEGGSGGAIALAVSDCVLMLEYSVYSVISPEGCASILWNDETKSAIAAEVQKLTANDLLKFGIIDTIVKEPVGGAHRNKQQAVENLRSHLIRSMREVTSIQNEERRALRAHKFMTIGDQFVEH
ncbi:MAG: acetyl-CoA carboxylase carboxyltransferase subunit alpha [Holosporales bacterium]|jgi:acetyl-CoA carboxylase carboxyl transferase subunit alpha|nr:acetyl-CoA carboxylase carboxyltransferase subunit alpha [Holosporales bacterium]